MYYYFGVIKKKKRYVMHCSVLILYCCKNKRRYSQLIENWKTIEMKKIWLFVCVSISGKYINTFMYMYIYCKFI